MPSFPVFEPYSISCGSQNRRRWYLAIYWDHTYSSTLAVESFGKNRVFLLAADLPKMVLERLTGLLATRKGLVVVTLWSCAPRRRSAFWGSSG